MSKIEMAKGRCPSYYQGVNEPHINMSTSQDPAAFSFSIVGAENKIPLLTCPLVKTSLLKTNYSRGIANGKYH